MDTLELLYQKRNIYDHIFYEFEMYLNTYWELIKLTDSHKDYRFLKNVLIESHAVHLRNLIEFFNCEENCLNTNELFIGIHDLSFDDSVLKAKQTINKAIDHLTKERYTWAKTDRDLTIQLNEVIIKMFNNCIVDRIKRCVELLLDETDIKTEYYSDLQDQYIQGRLLDLKKTLDEI